VDAHGSHPFEAPRHGHASAGPAVGTHFLRISAHAPAGFALADGGAGPWGGREWGPPRPSRV